MSKITKGNIKIVTERYGDTNGEIYNDTTCSFFQAQLNEYAYSKIKYTKNNVILYIPYIKYDNRVFFYRQEPNYSINENNVNIAIMADLIYIPSKGIMQTIKRWVLMCGENSKSKYIV